MKNIIATWICIDDKAHASHFPSAKGISSEVSTQKIYWRCVCTFFTVARYHNPSARLVLFSNQEVLPKVDQTDVGTLLKKLEVHFYVTPFEYITPPGYYREWRNQFYEFSIFRFITNHLDFDEDDNFLLLDSDCIVAGNLAPLFNEIAAHGCITYNIDYEVNQVINGISRSGMRSIFSELLGTAVKEIPAYHGGEFYAATIAFTNRIMQQFYVVWEQLLTRHAEGSTYLNEEAHVLSYLYYLEGIEGGEANRFIKRLWTDPSTFRNVEVHDAALLIWHLPAEKTTGFKDFFYWLQDMQFELAQLADEQLIRQARKTFMVPSVPVQYKPYYAVKSFVKGVAAKMNAARAAL